MLLGVGDISSGNFGAIGLCDLICEVEMATNWYEIRRARSTGEVSDSTRNQTQNRGWQPQRDLPPNGEAAFNMVYSRHVL
jgi:hypothetical protein